MENLLQMRDWLKFILDFNDTQSDQLFTNARLNKALNVVYTREVNRCKQEGDNDFFKAFQEVTWSSGEVTFSLPAVFKGDVLRVMDVTDDVVGSKILLSEYGVTAPIFFKDRNTLQWGTTGPSSDRTLRVLYLAQPQELIQDGDEPELIPAQFRELLCWAAAIELREIADNGKVPDSWRMNLHNLRLDYHKHASLGRFQDDPQWMGPRDSDVYEDVV